jgi:hypothetical protein
MDAVVTTAKALGGFADRNATGAIDPTLALVLAVAVLAAVGLWRLLPTWRVAAGRRAPRRAPAHATTTPC